METGARYKVTSSESRLETMQGALRFVQSLSDPEAAWMRRALERAVMLEMTLREVIAEAEWYFTLVMQPTMHRREYEKLQRAIAEGKARLKT